MVYFILYHIKLNILIGDRMYVCTCTSTSKKRRAQSNPTSTKKINIVFFLFFYNIFYTL